MRAERIIWKSEDSKLEPTDFLAKLKQGIEIELEDIEYITENELLSYRGSQVLLYIKDTKKDEDTLVNEPENAVRYHVSYCKKLEQMKGNERYDRYVVTNDTSGIFESYLA